MKAPFSISAEIDTDEMNHAVRYTFNLFGGDENHAGEVKRSFIIDVPHDDTADTDVWVLNHIVDIGDSPEDGFATYTPVSQTVGANPDPEKKYDPAVDYHKKLLEAGVPVTQTSTGFTLGTTTAERIANDPRPHETSNDVECWCGMFH